MSAMAWFNDERDWFFTARFGLFIHWGLYALNGWHEQEQWRRPVDAQTYQALAQRFDPQDFDPDRWFELAAEAGMRYCTITTKHHDGFCLWPSAVTDFTVANTPYGKDIIAQVAAACRKHDIHLGLYYSVVDWHHPCYPNRGRHHELPAPKPGDIPDDDCYIAFLTEQVRELCTNYGPIHSWFWDMNVPQWRNPAINAIIRELQPACVINNRGLDEGDLASPERHFDPAINQHQPFTRPTEYCTSVGAWSWGYKRDEDYFTSKHLCYHLAEIWAKGGNYLLNIGPDGDGRLPPEAEHLLHAIGDWHRRVFAAFTGTTPDFRFCHTANYLVTRRDHTLYVVCMREPITAALSLLNLASIPTRAICLNHGRDIPISTERLPVYGDGNEFHVRLRELPLDIAREEPLIIELHFTEHQPLLRATAAADLDIAQELANEAELDPG